MTKQERDEEIRFLKSECSSYKHRLIEIQRRMDEVSKKEADRLGNIIGRLEHWQVT